MKTAFAFNNPFNARRLTSVRLAKTSVRLGCWFALRAVSRDAGGMSVRREAGQGAAEWRAPDDRDARALSGVRREVRGWLH